MVIERMTSQIQEGGIEKKSRWKGKLYEGNKMSHSEFVACYVDDVVSGTWKHVILKAESGWKRWSISQPGGVSVQGVYT